MKSQKDKSKCMCEPMRVLAAVLQLHAAQPSLRMCHVLLAKECECQCGCGWWWCEGWTLNQSSLKKLSPCRFSVTRRNGTQANASAKKAFSSQGTIRKRKFMVPSNCRCASFWQPIGKSCQFVHTLGPKMGMKLWPSRSKSNTLSKHDRVSAQAFLRALPTI